MSNKFSSSLCPEHGFVRQLNRHFNTDYQSHFPEKIGLLDAVL